MLSIQLPTGLSRRQFCYHFLVLQPVPERVFDSIFTVALVSAGQIRTNP